MRRDELMIDRDTVRVQISLAKDRGQSTYQLEKKLSQIEASLSADRSPEPLEFAAARIKQQRKTQPRT
jgi:hypothetical protein